MTIPASRPPVSGGEPAGENARLSWLLLIVGIATALRLAHLTTQSLWIDEGYSLEYARIASPIEVIRDAASCHATECFSPLHPMLLHFLIGWLGDSVVVLRGFSALCGVLVVLVLMRVARLLFDAPTAILAGSIVAISAFAVWYSQDARPYSLLLLLVSLELWGLTLCRIGAGNTPGWWRRLLLALAVGLGLLGNILFGISAAGLAAAHFATTLDRQRWWATWWPAGVASLPALLLFAATPVLASPALADVTWLRHSGILNLAYSLFGQLVGITFGPPQIALRAGDRVEVLKQHLPALLAAGLLMLALATTLIWALRHRKPADPRSANLTLLTISIAIGAGLMGLLMLVTGFSWGPRHAFFLFPPLVLALSWSLRQLGGAPAPAARSLAGLALALIAVTNLWGIYNYFEDPRYRKDDYREATARLIRAEQSGEPTALLCGKVVLLRYYGDSTTVDLTEVHGAELIRRLQQLAAPRAALVVAFNRQFDWEADAGGSVESLLGGVFEVRGHEVLQYFDIYHLAVRR